MNTSFRKAILFRAFFTSLALGIAGYAMAHSGATGIVKTRMDQMMQIGEAMKTIGQMIQGKTVFDAKAARIAANAVAENAKAIPDLFPHGSNKAPSEAVAAIWENWEEFKTLASEMEKKCINALRCSRKCKQCASAPTNVWSIGKNLFKLPQQI